MNIIKRSLSVAMGTVQLVFFCGLGANVQAQKPDSLDIKIGQMLLIGFPKAEADPRIIQDIQEGKVGGILIFEKNIPPRNSFAALKKIIWTYQDAAAIPLLVTIDQEGGRVNRLKEKYGFPRSITAEAMTKGNAIDSVKFYAEATASTLAGLGINVNFAPVVDVAVNPANPIIAKYGRAFSNNEDTVAMMAKEFIRHHRKYGVITSLKHFPGHGSSQDDTHLGMADITKTWNDRELVPYKNLIDSGYVDAIMTAHIVNKNLDQKGTPGTLSTDIITGILRKRLNYKGIVFSDDMQMHAITKHYKLDEAIRMAVNAGVDILTFSNNISDSDERTVSRVHGIIRRMVDSGEIPAQRIDESFRRIMRVKSQLKSFEQPGYFQKQLAEAYATIDRLKKENEALLTQEATGKKKKKKRKK